MTGKHHWRCPQHHVTRCDAPGCHATLAWYAGPPPTAYSCQEHLAQLADMYDSVLKLSEAGACRCPELQARDEARAKRKQPVSKP